MALVVLINDVGTTEIVSQFCKEKEIPYIVIMGRNYKGLTKLKIRDNSVHPYRILTTNNMIEVLHYCNIWTDILIDFSQNKQYLDKIELENIIENPDQYELSELLTSDKYLFIYGDSFSSKKLREKLEKTYELIEKDGNLQDMRNVKKESNPIYKYMQRVYGVNSKTSPH